MDRLAAANRLYVSRGQLRFKRYLDDFGYRALSNWWGDVGGAVEPGQHGRAVVKIVDDRGVESLKIVELG